MEKPDLEYEYIVLYGYEYRFSKEECDKILHFAKSENCKVIALGERQFKSDIFIKCRPDEVLGYFSEAKYIITDTFHGSIFLLLIIKNLFHLLERLLHNQVEIDKSWDFYSNNFTYRNV